MNYAIKKSRHNNLRYLINIYWHSIFLVTFFNLPIETEILKFWPLVFISLGIEILVLNNIALKQKMYIQYDFISFILIAIIIFLSFSTYAFSQCISRGIFYR